MELSMALPAIRTHKWPKLIESIEKSCKKHTWEIIFAGPFEPPVELANYKNLHFVKTYARPSAAFQMAAEKATGDIYFGLCADDAMLFEDKLDECIDYFLSLNNPKAIINMRYTEGGWHKGKTFPDSYWCPSSYPPYLTLPGVPQHYTICLNPLMLREQYVDLGGLDCSFEYPNLNLHDLAYRAQYAGFKVYHSPSDVFSVDNFDSRLRHIRPEMADHHAIEEANYHDCITFSNKYQHADALNPNTVKIPFDNWKSYVEPWPRRFGKKLYENYNEMLAEVPMAPISQQELEALSKHYLDRFKE